jgi:hypothetical protein
LAHGLGVEAEFGGEEGEGHEFTVSQYARMNCAATCGTMALP